MTVRRAVERWSLKRQLTFFLVVTSTAALLVASVAIGANEWRANRRALVREVTSLANVIAANSAAALVFGDSDAARETLDALAAEPSILAAVIYSADGDVLASYTRSDAPTGPGPIDVPDARADLAEGHRFADGHLEVRQAIVLDGSQVGRIQVRAGLQEMRRRLLAYAGLVGIIMVASVLVAFGISIRLQPLIAVPVQALHESEERLRLLSEASSEGIVLTDQGIIVDVNETALTFLGYEAGDLVGRPLLELADSEALPLAADPDRHEPVEPYETVLVRKDGTLLPVAASEKSMPYDGRLRRVILLRDLSEEREIQAALQESEQQLRELQKMEGIGRLAAGVAHDFNNLLTVVSGYGELLRAELSQDPQLSEVVDEVLAASKRATSLTRQLLAFSRKQVMQPKILDLSAVIDGVNKMLGRLLGEDIEVATISEEGLGRVNADPGQIEQVIVNLAVNARDAMPKGGALRIETRNVTLDEPFVRRHPGSEAGDYVQLVVADEGEGMDRYTQARVFEPFFTTKDVGRGTGLGLSTVYGIVKQSGGYIQVDSEPGRGATFTVYLPRIAMATEASSSEATDTDDDTKGSETILLVEDSEGVRVLARRILQSRGYTVLEAEGGDQAIWLSDRLDGPIHLLLTDVVMPGLSGPEAAFRIAESRPDTRILFMSGYTDDAIVHHGVLDGDVTLLQKPFTPDALAEAVRRMLDGKPVESRAEAVAELCASGPEVT